MFLVDLIRPYAVDLLGSAACAATLLTFAQKQMWSMRISAIAANIFFIGYGALGLLYPVLLLHLVLLPLNVARLIQLAGSGKAHRQNPSEEPKPILIPQLPQRMSASPPNGGRQGQARGSSLGSRSAVWDFLRPAPP